MSLLVVGLSHRSAPVSVLERASLNADAQLKLLQDTVAAEPAAEAAVLATCNRIELYADVDKFHAGVAELSTLLAQHSGVGLEELTPHLYVHYEDRAVHHLFSVACGLDSMVVGEGQILGQIKDSLARAQDLHSAGRLLNDLFQQALRVGKRAHHETGIDRAGQSLVTFGLEQLSAGADVQKWARGKKALVIGAGSMSSLAAATLARSGVAEIVVANRTFERAERLAQILSEGDDTDVVARAVPMDAVPGELTRADVAVSCTGATGLVLTADAVAAAVEGRTGAPAVEDTAVRETAVREAGETPLPGAGGAADENCPLDLSSVSSVPSGFSVMGEAAVAGMDAATLEQHGAWAAGGTVVDRPRETGRPGPEADAELIGALAATATRVGRVPERRRPEPVAEVPRPEPVLFVLDLAMPRDVDAAVHRLAGARLVDIESRALPTAPAPKGAHGPSGPPDIGHDGDPHRAP
ncbi:glutamyl-tRNA reductase, partial [Streptomyces sp. NPDC059409]|uniref:glutamyl-tRNA reductase n=1 Tax=Streptomyces sp. NPDC059409 TaxID=3346824 RepID=UPI0036C12E1D